jgi:hypothetical protein
MGQLGLGAGFGSCVPYDVWGIPCRVRVRLGQPPTGAAHLSQILPSLFQVTKRNTS